MAIDEKDLLQANATIIAGILILLTFVSIAGEVSANGQNEQLVVTPMRLQIVLAISPFVVSVFLLLTDGTNRFKHAVWFTKAGLVWLTGAVILLMMVSPT